MSVFDFKQKMPIMHLTSSSYKLGTETLESTLVYFCGIETFSAENKPRLQQNAFQKDLFFYEKEP